MSEKLDRRRVLLADDYPGVHSALTRLRAPWCDVVGGASAFVLKCRIGDDLVRAIQTTKSVTPAADA